MENICHRSLKSIKIMTWGGDGLQSALQSGLQMQ